MSSFYISIAGGEDNITNLNQPQVSDEVFNFENETSDLFTNSEQITKEDSDETSKINDKAQSSDSEKETDKIIERNGMKYIIRDDKKYMLSTSSSTYYIKFDPLLPSSVCGSEKINITVKGKLQLTLSSAKYNKCIADILFPPYNYLVEFDLYLYEEDPYAPDDKIDEMLTREYTYDCASVNLGYYGKTFYNVDLSVQAGGVEGKTIEVYATAEGANVNDILSSTYDVYNYINGECQCLSGECCNLASRPYKFKSSGSQPIGISDRYECEGTNSPTGTNYVKFIDFYCSGSSSSAYASDSTQDTCGTCEYCTANDATCNFYSSSASCGTKDCDSLDTSCRDYNDVDRYCSGTSATCKDSTCNSYTDKSKGTSCGTGKECDGSGTCITCESSTYLWCYDHGYDSQDCNKYIECYDSDSYWYNDCEYRKEKARECGSSYCDNWGKYCDGNNLKRKRNCWDKGCSNRRCYINLRVEDEFIQTCQYGCLDYYYACRDPNVKCYFDSDCPSDGWANLECNGEDITGILVDYTCKNPGQTSSYCDFTSSGRQIKEDCGDDSYSANYCYDNDAYRDFTDRGCRSVFSCYEETSKQKVQECGLAGCSNGKCNIVCYQNSDCGTAGWIGNPSCSNNDVYQDWKTYTCSNPGTSSASCSDSIQNKLKADCGDDSCDSFGDNYCKNNDVYHSRTCHDKGCSSGTCFDNANTEEEKVQACGLAGCSNGKCNVACYSNPDCGSNGFIDNPLCQQDDVFQNYRTYTCSNPGTVQASCSYNDELKLKTDCGENYCDDWQDNYCIVNDVYHKRTCYDKGCSNADCFNNPFVEEEKAEVCGDVGCENGACKFEIEINSLIEEEWYNTRSILLNITLPEKVKTLHYKVNSRDYIRLCSNCDKYSGKRGFSEGDNNLTIKAIAYNNKEHLKSISFDIDTIKPQKHKIYPLHYSNGTFGIKYTEANLESVNLYYWRYPIYTMRKEANCSSGNRIWCYTYVNLSKYNGQYIYYKFELKDKFFTVSSVTEKFLVDTSSPVMNVFSPVNNEVYINNRGLVYINISLSEKVKLEYKDNDLSWAKLCYDIPCSSYKKYRRFSFGQHNVTFKATDFAGNTDEKLVSFDLRQS